MTEPSKAGPKRKRNKRAKRRKASSLPNGKAQLISDSALLIPNIGVEVHKRPIMHPPIPSPYAGADQPKIVYISTKTPFISAVKRVQKLLALIEQREMGKVSLIGGEGSDKEKLEALDAGAIRGGKQEEVLLKATGKAIKNATDLARYFQAKEDLQVQLRTGTVPVVDDLIKVEKLGDGNPAEAQQMDEDIPDTRVRQLRMLEVAITKVRG